MQVNKNGFLVHTPGKKIKRERVKPEYALGKRLFVLVDDEAQVEVVLPNFSPIIELMKSEGWVEIR